VGSSGAIVPSKSTSARHLACEGDNFRELMEGETLSATDFSAYSRNCALRPPASRVFVNARSVPYRQLQSRVEWACAARRRGTSVKSLRKGLKNLAKDR
jgi:hypothetical protein